MPILMLAAVRLDGKVTGFELGADDYLTKLFELRELVLQLRALDRRRVHNESPLREIACVCVVLSCREVYHDGRYIALTGKELAVLEVLAAAEGSAISAEELFERAWDENADPFINAVCIAVSALCQCLGEPRLIATVAGIGSGVARISTWVSEYSNICIVARMDTLLHSDALSRFGYALSDSTRTQILLHLRRGPGYPSDLAERIGVSRQILSNHLACLRGCGLVVAIQEGRRSRYELADARIGRALDDLVGLVLAVDPACCPAAATEECC